MTDTLETLSFEIVRNVTLPFIIIPSDGSEFYLKFNTAIAPDNTTFSERVRRAKAAEPGKEQNVEPMHLAEVTNLKTGEVGRLVLHQVLESNLNEAYPNETYVGKLFQIKKQKAAKGRYFNFNIIEIKLKGSAPDAPKQAAKK